MSIEFLWSLKESIREEFPDLVKINAESRSAQLNWYEHIQKEINREVNSYLEKLYERLEVMDVELNRITDFMLENDLVAVNEDNLLKSLTKTKDILKLLALIEELKNLEN